MICTLEELYQQEAPSQRERYEQLRLGLESQFGPGGEPAWFSAPGRSEIGGNHTDHNHGKVLAAAVSLDAAACARKTGDNRVSLKSA